MMCDRSPAEIPPNSACEQSVQFPEPIAIIGIGCRFPGGVASPDGFWRNLIAGVDAISEVPADRWNRLSFFDSEPGKPGKSHTCRGGFIEGIDQFDPHFFGISPREAARMDPQQRLLLEVAWEALEDGGQVATSLAGSRVSVFVGISSWDYAVLQNGFRDRTTIDAYMNTGGSLSIAANRISYCFDFRGPSAAVDTACSSALVAVHLACQSIWAENATLALAGGVNALLTPDSFIGFSRMGMLSPDGRCMAFDARANGFVRSEGAGVVVLKQLARARADGDRIYATIRGTAVNQDGRSEGMTVPSKASQIELLRAAYRNAGVSPKDAQYIEAHGTGTPVGDPIEASAIGAVVGEGRPSHRPCLLGSVKTQIGHLEAGSGIAGLIKTALALHHRRIPPNLHFESPNPAIDFERLHLHVPTKAQSWPAASVQLLAGVNSFGYGGTNAHIVLQGLPPAPAEENPTSPEPSSVLLPFSARAPEALRAVAGKFAEFVKTSPEDVSLLDIAANAADRRTHHTYRLAVVAHSKQDLAESLAKIAEGKPAALSASGRTQPGQSPRIAFVCSGQGPQWWGMGRQLLRQESVFRAKIQRVDAIIRSLGPWSLIEELGREEAHSRMNETSISQPSIFAIQVALAALWESWGVRPEAVIGHSVGEVAAAYLAGVFDLEDATRIIYHRGRCMDRASSHGRMLAAGVSGQEAKRLIAPFGGRVSVAAINAPHSTTLSGEAGPLEEIARKLEERNVFARFLQVQYAFHSAQMDPVRAELIHSLQGIRPRPACLPFVSTVTGNRARITEERTRCSTTCTGNCKEGEDLGPEYWWLNVRRTVLFAQGVDQLLALGCDTIVELSPHPVLAAAVAECFLERGKQCVALPSLRRYEDERATMLHAAAELHVHGHSLDWRTLIPGSRRFLRLPTYPWQRQRYWAESEESRATRLAQPVHPLLGLATGKPTPGWETRLDLRLLPDLANHRVQGVVILPATAYLECSLAAAREQFGDSGCQLEEVKLSSPCFPPDDGALWLHTSFRPEDSNIQVASRPTGADHTQWTNHFRAVLRPLSMGSETFLDLEELRSRCPRAFGHSECYDYIARLGLNYGPRFQGVTRAWQGVREALGEVVLPEESVMKDDFIIHPALLDSCLHVVIVADPDFKRATNQLYLPVEIERLRLYRKPGQRLWSHARLREKTEQQLVADIDVYDDHGQLLMTVVGMRSQRMATEKGQTLDELLYAYQWIEQPLPERPAAETLGARSQWLLFADRGGIAEELAGRLQKAGDQCLIVSPGACFASIGQHRRQINPVSKNDMQCLLDSLREESSLPVRGIIHLWSLDAPANDFLLAADLQTVQDQQLLSMLHLVQCWKQTAKESPRLYQVTRSAQSVGAALEDVQVAQSPLIGFGRVILNECASFRGKLIDLDADTRSSDIESLFLELLADDDEDEVALRGSNRYVHRFVPTRGDGPVKEVKLTASPYRLISTQPGTIDGLTLQAMQRKAPGPGMVEIEVRAAGLNFSDVMKSLGLYPGLPEGPVPLGAECSGVLTAIGEGVEGWSLGDEVLAVAPFAFASHVVARAEFIARKPVRMSFEDAATMPIAFLTAAYALDHLAHLDAGERVLIHSATGGVGLAAVQHAQRLGAEIFATAGSDEKRQYLRDRGIQHVMDSRTLAFAAEVKSLTGGRGVDVILNSLAGDAIAQGIASLAEYGRFLEIGKRDIYQNTRIGLLPFHKNLSFFAIDLDRIMRERPALLGKLLRQIVEDLNADKLDALPHRVFPVSEIAAAFRHMQQSKHIGKVIVSMAEPPAKVTPGEDPVTFRANASYLVTGGLGGFGLATAGWLARHGARNIILVGRSAKITVESRRAIEELEATGARVRVMQADVASESHLKRLLASIADQLPPLRGIFHAAMVLEDCLLQNLDRERLRRVLAPKVQGAWNLHRQTRHLALDHFVLFSSLSSVFGHAGQANYAAANSFLDALAWHRRSRGLPCLTVNWGHLGEVGYLAQRQELSERLTRQGVLPFTVAEAMTALERVVQRQAVQVSVMRVDWSRWTGLSVTGRVSPRFADLIQQVGTPGGERGTSSRARLQQCGIVERQALLGEILRSKLAGVLGAAPAGTDWETSLLQLGLDSLMAVEMVNWIQAELGVTVPVVELMRSSGVSSLSRLLLDRMGGQEDATPALQAADQTSAGEDFPVSYGQRALGFLYHLDPSSPALNLSFCSRISSEIDPRAFRQAFQSLIDRHPALRTTFEERDGELRQRIHAGSEVALEFIDASSWGDGALRSRLNEEAARPFDLEHGPLLRLYLFTRSLREHIFLFTAHHIVGDFWSLVVLMEEMRVVYPAALNCEAPALPPLAADYRQFIRWQSERLGGAEGERMRQWWTEHLAGVSPVLDLPTDRPRPARFTHRGGSIFCGLDEELTAKLKELAAREGTTLFAALLAGFQALLSKLTGQDDFVVGSPFAGRPRQEFEGIVGYFINMLPLRARLKDDPSFRALLQNVQAAVFDAFEYQDYPFSLIIDRLGIDRDPSRTPLIQASFTLEKAHRKGETGASRFLLPQSQFRMEIGGLETEPFPIEQRFCQADLEMVLEENDGRIEGMLCYNLDLFETRTAERFAALYGEILRGLLTDPDAPLSRIPCATAREKQLVLEDWNRTDFDFGEPLCLHELFANQVAATPGAIAVRQQERIATYAELDAWANCVASDLRQHGIRAGSLVVVCLDRSPELIAAIIGILKTGAAYVPVDPECPHERLCQILQETGSPVLVAHDGLHNRWSQLDVPVVAVGDQRSAARADEQLETGHSTPSDLAYVIYTSGSTGRPKGVMVDHAAVCNTVRWRLHHLPTGRKDRLLLSVPGHFDASVTVIFPALASGAELVLARPGEERDPTALLSRISRDRITQVQCLPSTLLSLIEERGFASACATVSRFCCGGEPMSAQLPRRLFERHPTALFNLYGPTETAVEASAWQCRDSKNDSSVPIGRPIANVRVYVLDRNLKPVSIGISGELFIGGPGVARGYLGDDELTAARFPADPFRATAGGQMFRTGDRVRWRADGTLEFLGRLDRQVKVNGYRIEPAEIEAALRSHPAIEDAVIAVQDAIECQSQIVAYLVANSGEEWPSRDSLRDHLLKSLPRHMLPARFVPVAMIPRNSSGKVDLQGLQSKKDNLEKGPVAGPRDRFEAYLAEVWSDLLAGENIDVNDHFFERGGNSLQALSLIGRVRETLGVPVAAATVFDSPTLAGFARRLRNDYSEAVNRLFGVEEVVESVNGGPLRATGSPDARPAREDLIVPLQSEGNELPLFLAHPPGGIVACYQPLAVHVGRQRPVFGIRARGHSPGEILPARLEEMAAEYVAAVRTVQPDGPYLLGGWSLGGVVAYEMAQQLQELGEQVDFLALLDSTLPFGTTNAAYLEGIDQSGREFGLEHTLAELGELAPEEQLPFLWRHVKALGLIDEDAPEELVQEIIDDLKRLFHAHVTLVSDYTIRPYAGRITLFRPSDSPIAATGPLDRGWSQLAEVDVRVVPGQHHTMVKEPHARILAREMLDCLSESLPRCISSRSF